MKFIVQKKANHWYWWLVARNGTELARSWRAFTRKSHAVESVRKIIANFNNFAIEIVVDER